MCNPKQEKIRSIMSKSVNETRAPRMTFEFSIL